LCASGYAAGQSIPYYVGVGAAAGHLAWQIGTVNLQDGVDCMRKFISNKWFGAIIFAGIVLGKFFLSDGIDGKEQQNTKSSSKNQHTPVQNQQSVEK